MIRSISAVLLFLSVTAGATGPNFSGGGFVVSVQYGPGFWGLDRARLSNQVGPVLANTFITETQNTHTVSLSAAYNILGHASVGADLTATGWNLTKSNRGGAGFLIGKVAWHPLQLVWMRKERRPLSLDLSPFFGLGYGITGQMTGADGLVFETGLNVDYFFTKYFGIGFFARFVFMSYSSFYLDYNNRSLPGSTLPLKDGSGGNFITIGFAIHFRAGD